MPNGKPGDAPWTDFFMHGHEVFPEDIAKMLRAIHSVSPELIRHLSHPDMWDWEAKKNLDEGRQKLRRIIEENNVPYDDKT